MCGILGQVGGEVGEEFAAQFHAALNLQTHRGPDDEGVAHPALDVWLGHRRLSIIDLSPAGHQPMTNESGDLHVVFNGEIYNFLELRPQLEARGHVFKSQSDTEVLLHGYEEWGSEGLVERLRGMFAFALYDAPRRRLVLVRDRLGVKPLYYHLARDKVIFASEIKSILHLRPELRDLNLSAVSSFLSYRMVLGEETFFRSIHALAPGTILVREAGTTGQKCYWQIPDSAAEEDKGEAYYIEATREMVTTATHRRLISDVPLGAYLSGGLDSSILVAVMARGMDHPVKTFCIGFGDDDFDEFTYAKLLQARYRTDHTEIRVDSRGFLEAVPSVIRCKDGPLGVQNEVALYLMSRRLKQDITVVLSGEGADEMFGGYGRIFRSPFDWERWQDTAFRQTNTGFAEAFGRRYPTGLGSELDHFLALYGWLDRDEKWQALSPEFRREVDGDAPLRAYWERKFDRYGGLSPYDRYMRVFQEVHLQGLLYRLDTATMGASVESRNPFVDHELVEFAARIPWWHKLKWKSEADRIASLGKTSDEISERHDLTKNVLRQAFRADLPREIVERRKVGFPVPLHRWFGGAEKGQVRAVLLDSKCRSRGIFASRQLEQWLAGEARFESHSFGLKIWMLMNIEWFLRLYEL